MSRLAHRDQIANISLKSYTRSSSKSSAISEELGKFKQMKAQGILHSLPTETSEEPLPSVNLEYQDEEKSRTAKSETSSPALRQGLNRIYHTKSSERYGRHKRKEEDPYGLATPAWAKTGANPYLKSLKRASTPTDSFSTYTSNYNFGHRGSKQKNPGMLSVNSLSISHQEKSRSAVARSPSPKSAALPKRLEIQNFGRSSVMTESNSSKNSQNSTFRKIDAKMTNLLYDPKSRQSTADMSPMVSTPGVSQKLNSDRGLDIGFRTFSEETQDVQTFGLTMVEAYENLNAKFKNFTEEKQDTKSMIKSLQEEVAGLEKSLNQYQLENTKLKQSNKKQSARSITPIDRSKKLAELRQSLATLYEDNQEIKKTLEFLKDENDVLKKCAAEMGNYQDLAGFYKNLADQKSKERATLTKETIYLRSELDRSHSDFLELKKTQILIRSQDDLSLSKSSDSIQLTLDIVRCSSANKKTVSWKDELEERRPFKASASIGTLI